MVAADSPQANPLAVSFGNCSNALLLADSRSGVRAAGIPAGSTQERIARRRSRLEGDQASVGGLEAAGFEVERAVLGVKVDVKPLAACPTGFARSNGHKLLADPPPAMTGRNNCVEDERVKCSVPRHIDKSRKLGPRMGANPAEAVRFELSPPIVIVLVMIKAFSVKRVQRIVGDIAAPFVPDIHPPRVTEPAVHISAQIRRWMAYVVGREEA